MKRLLTKCCLAERKCIRDDFGNPESVYCEQCDNADPDMDWVEMCDGCKRPAKHCNCP